MRSKRLLWLVPFVATAFCAGKARAQNTLVPPVRNSPWIVAGEVGGSLACAAGLGYGLGMAAAALTPGNPNFMEPGSIGRVLAGFAGLTLGYGAGSGLGTWAVGSIAKQHGKGWAAMLGGFAGVPVGLGFAWLATWLETKGDGGILLLIPAFAAPPAGAVLGYNLSRPKVSAGTTWLDRVSPPQVGLRLSPTDQNRTRTALDLRLLTARF